MPQKHLRRWQREEQVRELFRLVGAGELTAYDVAKVLDVAPSKMIYDLLNKLVEDNVLEVKEVVHRKNTMKKVYRLCRQD